MVRQPKGEVLFKVLLVGIFTILAGGIVGGFIACGIGLICRTGGDDGGSGATAPSNVCASAPNACGQSTVGTLSGGGGGGGGGSCSATPPDNSSCPAPIISPNGFTANPSTVGANGASTLTWSASNATACTISGDNGFGASDGASGSVLVGGLEQTAIFTLTCEDGPGGPTASQSLKIIVDPHYREI